MIKTYGTLFSGVGGADLGLINAGYKPVYAVEWNQGALDILTANHEIPTVIHGDVNAVEFCSLSSIDLLWASPVCCSYSLANHSRGETELDLSSSESIARAADYAQSIIIENVPQYYLGEAFAMLKSKLEYLGFIHHNVYRLNAAKFGNPASRDRSYAVFSRNFFKLELPPESNTNWIDELLKYRECWVESKLTEKQQAVVDKLSPLVMGAIAIERCGYYGAPSVYINRGAYPCIKSHSHHDGKNPKPGYGKIGSYRSYMDFIHEGQSYSVTPQLLGVLNGFPIDYRWLDNRAQASGAIGNTVVGRMAQILVEGLKLDR